MPFATGTPTPPGSANDSRGSVWQLDSAHDAAKGPVHAVEHAQAIFVGGGNTFRLIDTLWKESPDRTDPDRVRSGMPAIGSSAGSSIGVPHDEDDQRHARDRSTADIRRAWTRAVPDQSQYVDPAPGSAHMGETREERIREFHEENDAAVIGLREGAWLEMGGPSLSLRGTAGAKLFQRGQLRGRAAPAASIDFLL